jgi:serine/threonine protein kinase
MAPGGVAYLAMEYLDGVSLHERLYQAGGTLPEGTVLQLGEQAASALSVMHERKIVVICVCASSTGSRISSSSSR